MEPKCLSKGLGRDRQNAAILGKVSPDSWEMTCQQTTSVLFSNEKIPLNGRLSKVIALDEGYENNFHGKKERIFKHDRIQKRKKHPAVNRPPTLTPGKISDKDVKFHTGFKSLKELLEYICVVCNGDLDKICHTTSCLTWFEEWVFYFEMMLGKALTTWEIAEHDTRGYGLHQKGLREVFDQKTHLVLECRESWPAFATYKEDKQFMGEEAKKDYAGKRVVMWDMTNVQCPKSSDATLQSLTFSKYYAMNCFKGGIGIQPCGWIVLHDLWTGAVGDSMYQDKSGIFAKQDDFAKKDRVLKAPKDNDDCGKLVEEDDDVIPFTNIFDKGYRNRLAAWRAGRQLTLQPDFAKSDRKFRRKETLSSAAVASNRAANERAVKMAKLCGYVKRGLSQRQTFARLQKSWMAHGFQLNFMYLPVC